MGNRYEMVDIEPLNLDLGADDAILEPEQNPYNTNKKLGLSDFPSLRDLETSNAYTKSNMVEIKK